MSVKKLILNNEYYIFPENSYAINYGNRFCVVINGATISSLNNYKVTKDVFLKKRDFSYIKQALPSHGFFSQQYENISGFLAKNPNMSYLQFDNKTCENLILFSFLPKLDFEYLNKVLERIVSTLPFIINIFARPVIRLTAEEFIVPIDAVKKTNQKTVQHLLRHSELWKNTDDNKIKPARLLTNLYEDDYTIYENKVFCRTVDQIIAFLSEYKNFFTDVIYNKISFEMNLMDKSNHLYHYLALGKLYVGFVKSDELFAERCGDYIQKFDKIISKLSGHKVRDIYKYNRKAEVTLPVSKTNILAMHKDYRHIYTLKRIFDKTEEEINRNGITAKLDTLQNDYSNFCAMLTVFSVAHFRFTAKDNPFYKDGKFTEASFTFAKWRVKLSSVRINCLESDAILMTVACGRQKHVTLLIPTISDLNKEKNALIESLLADIAKKHKADNYVFLTLSKSKILPSYQSAAPLSCGILPVSVNDINSFKRIQKLLLASMINVSQHQDICPFCGGDFQPKTEDKEEIKTKISAAEPKFGFKTEHMSPQPQTGALPQPENKTEPSHNTNRLGQNDKPQAEGYYCKKCKTELYYTVCESCKQPFWHTNINYPAFKNKDINARNYTAGNYWKFYNDKDSQLNYRNITDLTPDGLPVCPHCNKTAASHNHNNQPINQSN